MKRNKTGYTILETCKECNGTKQITVCVCGSCGIDNVIICPFCNGKGEVKVIRDYDKQ